QTLVDATQADDVKFLLAEALASPIVSYDFESSDPLQHPAFREASQSGKDFVDVLSQRLAGISINYGRHAHKTIYLPFDHAETANFPQEWARWVLQVLSSREERCVVQNAAFELAVSLADQGIMPRAPYDTQIMASYVDENESASLKDMSRRVLRYDQVSYADVTKGRLMCQLTGEEVLSYGCDDSLVTSHLFDLFRLDMQLEGSWDFYATYEVDPAQDDAYSFEQGTDIDLALSEKLRAASKERFQTASAAVRAAIRENVDNTDEGRIKAGAQTLLTERWMTDQFKYEGKISLDVRDAYERAWRKAWMDCLYSDRVDVVRDAKTFVPTARMLATVVDILEPNAPPAATANTAKALYAYAQSLEDFLKGRPVTEASATLE
ncbi:MAG: hypothetical protein EOM24_33825, partial [Chloroflexia bacterium]|nr:hypothetical protein [Chloroflexia bacterium]